MGNTIPNTNIIIRTKVGKTFRISYHDLVDHLLLLRQVIAHPEMTHEGTTLNFFIQKYCERMAHQKMQTTFQQVVLPWQLDWIWHVHRLHPLAYYNDCINHLPGGRLVEKCYRHLIPFEDKSMVPLTSESSHASSFVCSIDLAKAVVRQRQFLEKFQKHFLYLWNFEELDRSAFRQMVQNYISFMKLARQNEMIVPTFDIDLIWHTHMRFPSQYRECSTVLCGFVLDHNDSVERDKLDHAYRNTAKRWKNTYRSNSNRNDDWIILDTNEERSSCATVDKSDSTFSWWDSTGGCESSCSSCGGD